jgi:hypothetical protein
LSHIPERPRLTIEERAERRRFVLSRGHDRFSALLRVLQGGQELPIRRRRRLDTVDWEQVRWTGVKVVFAAVVLYATGTFVYSIWRDLKVDTWAGPDATVQSGQRLQDCAAVNRLATDAPFPAWVRFGGVVYGRGDGVVTVEEPARTTAAFAATGHVLGELRLFHEPTTPRVAVLIPRATSAVIYEPVAGCR